MPVSCVQEVVALQIMRANYEQLVKAHQRAPQVPEDLVPDETKFQVKIIFFFFFFLCFLLFLTYQTLQEEGQFVLVTP